MNPSSFCHVRHVPRVLVILVALVASACVSKHEGPTSSDTTTNWLHSCKRDKDCHGESSCISGTCSVACSAATGLECDVLSELALCVEPQRATAYCDLPCRSDRVCAELGRDYACQAGVCRPQVTGQSEQEAQLPGRDAGAPPPRPGNDASTDASFSVDDGGYYYGDGGYDYSDAGYDYSDGGYYYGDGGYDYGYDGSYDYGYDGSYDYGFDGGYFYGDSGYSYADGGGCTSPEGGWSDVDGGYCYPACAPYPAVNWQPSAWVPYPNDQGRDALFNAVRAIFAGRWHGVASSSGDLPYLVDINFEASGHYGAHCSEIEQTCCLAFEYGTDDDTQLKQYRLVDAQSGGYVIGEIDIAYGYNGRDFYLSGYQGELAFIERDLSGNGLRFWFRYGDSGAGTIKYDLRRVQ